MLCSLESKIIRSRRINFFFHGDRLHTHAQCFIKREAPCRRSAAHRDEIKTERLAQRQGSTATGNWAKQIRRNAAELSQRKRVDSPFVETIACYQIWMRYLCPHGGDMSTFYLPLHWNKTKHKPKPTDDKNIIYCWEIILDEFIYVFALISFHCFAWFLLSYIFHVLNIDYFIMYQTLVAVNEKINLHV